MIYGGLPQIVSFQSERQKADYLKNIFANVYLKDVIERNKIQNVDEIGILVDVLASAIGAPTNPSKIANTFASERQMTYANKTISKHIDHGSQSHSLFGVAQQFDMLLVERNTNLEEMGNALLLHRRDILLFFICARASLAEASSSVSMRDSVTLSFNTLSSMIIPGILLL